MGYQNFFATRLATDIGTSDTTITLETPPTETSGRLVLEARNPTQKEIIKYSGVSGNQITGVLRGQGGTSAKTHVKNSLVEMNMTAEDIQDLYDAFDAYAETAGDGWLPLLNAPTVATGYNKGNRSFEMTYPGIDLTTVLSPGMRLKVTRDTAAPTQCVDLEASSSQYASKSSPTGIAFTDDFTCEAWIKLESYATGVIVARGAAVSGGFNMYMNSSGQIVISAWNSTEEKATSYQSVPLNRWSHIAASMNMSGNSFAIYIDGVSVPLTSTGSLSTLVQTGDLYVGRNVAGNYFNGKITDVRVWSTVRNATEIRDNMNQQLVGSETNLVAYFKLNGDFNDSTANANHLTASGGATATDTDNPFHDTEYAIVTKVALDGSDTDVTVFTGTDHTIPNDTLTNPYYSTQSVPFGFPRGRDKWTIEALGFTGSEALSNDTFVNAVGGSISVPVGSWVLEHQGSFSVDSDVAVSAWVGGGLSTAPTSVSDSRMIAGQLIRTSSGSPSYLYSHKSNNISVSATTTYYLIVGISSLSGSASAGPVSGQNLMGQFIVKAECAYL